MTDLSRGTRPRRGGRRPGWLLLTVLLVLAIAASSALVFTNRVELLKLAVILALWAAVVAAFVSVIYRRQSDVDQAKVRDLKLVYDLQLDREISARREYELHVETQLRQELASELRAQAADEVAGLRAELAALRANLEILFDADLSHRPAIETERTTVHAYRDWSRDAESAGRVTASRIDIEDREDVDARTEESPIIDVHEEPHPPEHDWPPTPMFGGAHRRPSETEPESRRHVAEKPEGRRRVAEEPQPRAWSPPPQPPQPVPPQPTPPEPVSQPAPEPQFTWASPQPEPPKPPEPPDQEPPPPPPPPPRPEPERVARQVPQTDWQPAPAEGEWIPAGTPGSNWASPAENGSAGEYVGRRRAPEPVMSSPAAEVHRGRHSAPPDATDPGRPTTPPTLAAETGAPPPHPEPEAPPPAPPQPRHRSADELEQTGGQSVADLLARLQATPTGGGRRRRREE
jgi:Domain of unknown function (DUF6779)